MVDGMGDWQAVVAAANKCSWNKCSWHQGVPSTQVLRLRQKKGSLAGSILRDDMPLAKALPRLADDAPLVLQVRLDAACHVLWQASEARVSSSASFGLDFGHPIMFGRLQSCRLSANRPEGSFDPIARARLRQLLDQPEVAQDGESFLILVRRWRVDEGKEVLQDAW